MGWTANVMTNVTIQKSRQIQKILWNFVSERCTVISCINTGNSTVKTNVGGSVDHKMNIRK